MNHEEKTVVIWNNELDDFDDTKFFILKGDYRHLDKVYIHQDEDLSGELYSLIYTNERQGYKENSYDSFPIDAVKEGAYVILAGIRG